MFTDSVATTTVNIEMATTTGALNCPTSVTGSHNWLIGTLGKMITAAEVMTMAIAEKSVIVVGSATVCPMACSRWLRPKRVKSGMLSDSVAQKANIAGSEGRNVANGPGSCIR